ncbi:MAG: hypothetical protein IJK18_05200 [Clostridia bacterium]|nr:hypothetical protein [Clostridia bacterium]
MYLETITSFNNESKRLKQIHFDDTDEVMSFSAEQAAGSLLRIADASERIATAYERMATALEKIAEKK